MSVDGLHQEHRDGECGVEPECCFRAGLVPQMVKGRDNIWLGAAGCGDKFSIEESGMVSWRVADAVEAGDRARHQLLGACAVGLGDLGGQGVVQACIEATEVAHFPDLGQGPGWH